MARALLTALLCAATAAATRYVDYSGVKMPQYAGDYDARDLAPPHSSDDYHGRSPDSPASLDYKYEEEQQVKTSKPATDMEEVDDWHKPARKQRGLAPSDTDVLEALEKHNFDVEEPAKLKQSHRINQHRSRLKNKKQPQVEQQRRLRHGRRRDDVSDRNDYLLDKDEFQEDKSKDFEDEINPFAPKAAERFISRKARDRHPKGRTNGLVEDDDLFAERRQTVDSAPKIDYDDNRRRKRPFERKDQFEDVMEFDEESGRKNKGVMAYPEYNDNFYDMRRVQSIRDKLPSLLRRTSPRVSQPTLTASPEWFYRRVFEPSKISLESTKATTTTTSTTTTIKPPTKATTVTTRAANNTATNSSKELSLAEKSRLSILKKAQKKELKAAPVTRKPPVLMQVTKNIPTVVMVEPPGSRDPWMRAREVSDDSPERLEKVKRLMRQKLVAGARNIQELTDNWDELICDYLDVSLLDDSALTHTISLPLVLITIVLYIFVM